MSQVPGNGRAEPGAMAALYPFLYAGTSDLPAVLAQVRASTVAKAAEIDGLRQAVSDREAARLAECATAMAARFAAGGRLFAFGNGGSATDAQQLATLFLNPGPGVAPRPAFALTNDTSVVTALCNDVGVEVVFARQLAAFGGAGDIAVGLSTSGNSENLVRAFGEASRRGMLTVGLAGYEGGKMAELDSIDYLFVAPSSSVHRIQEAQTTIYHVLWELTTRAVAPEGQSNSPASDPPPNTGWQYGSRPAQNAPPAAPSSAPPARPGEAPTSGQSDLPASDQPSNAARQYGSRPTQKPPPEASEAPAREAK